MGESESEAKREGWLYIIRSNRFGLHFSKKRYFILADHLLKSFKSISDSKTKVSLLFVLSLSETNFAESESLFLLQDGGRSAVIDSCIRVTDNGRESVHRKVCLLFQTLLLV